MQKIIPYLHFNGNCEEAVHFYEKALGAKLERIVRFADMPCPDGTPMPQEDGKRIAHARMILDGMGTVFAGDCPSSMPYGGIQGITLTLNYDTVEQAQRVFDALSAGGKVEMPMQPAMWAKTFGMLTDRFGAPWMINGEVFED